MSDKDQKFKYDEFLICTVREATDDEKMFLKTYVIEQKSLGRRVYYPAENTNQKDETGGYQICSDNLQAMIESEVVSVFWTDKSQGTKFDLGMAFYQHKTNGKKVRLVNRHNVERIVHDQRAKGTAKSFEMVLLGLDDLARK